MTSAKGYADRTTYSYDGDDNVPKGTSQVHLNDSSEPLQPTNPADNVQVSTETKTEPPVINDNEVPDHDQPVYNNDQDGASTWTNGQGNGAQDVNYIEPTAEEESRGIGIKEDG